MQNTLEIQNLSREDKLRMIETIWEDLLKEGEEVPGFFTSFLIT